MLIGIAAELLADRRPEHRVAAMFVDSAFGSPIVERLHALGFENVYEINFGGPSPDLHQANLRAYMWNRTKDWLLQGAIPDDERFATGSRRRARAVHSALARDQVLSDSVAPHHWVARVAGLDSGEARLTTNCRGDS